MNLLDRLIEFGCPTYVDNSASRTRMGRPCCFYCDEPIDVPHADDCAWPMIEQAAKQVEVVVDHEHVSIFTKF